MGFWFRERFFLIVIYLHMLQLQNFKTKRKYITILQIGPKLHKNEKAIALDLLINRLFRYVEFLLIQESGFSKSYL